MVELEWHDFGPKKLEKNSKIGKNVKKILSDTLALKKIPMSKRKKMKRMLPRELK